MSSWSKYGVDVGALPRAERRRAARAVEKAANLDHQWFKQNPNRRTLVRWALPGEPVGAPAGAKCMAVIRKQVLGTYVKYLFVTPSLFLPHSWDIRDLSTEFAADTIFQLLTLTERRMSADALAALPTAGNA